ncbi:MAG: sigma-70 family RNA polymerase sigma factor [Elusimicrobia bacterium]|nr:sigma-70 family RNA polymerase sigma factor [Elusimicrobiota bacterium]
MENFPPDPVSKSPEDFVELVRRHSPKIFGLALRLCGNPVDGEDLAQETFIAAYRRFDQFRGDADFGSWAYRICVNLWKNRVRYEKRRAFWKHIPFFGGGDRDDGDPKPLDIADPRDVTDAPAEASERRRWVRDAIAGLHPEERAALVLREMEDKSYEEIAELLGVPLGTVKSRIARARQAVKARLAPFLGEKP